MSDSSEEVTENGVRWRPVVGFEGMYQVSDTGEVRGVDRVTTFDRVTKYGQICSVRRFYPGKLLTPKKSAGRWYVGLRKDSWCYTLKVHTLVLEAFIGPRPEGTMGCHWDGNSRNNHLNNLRWDTRSNNTFDSVRHGTHPQASKTHCKWGHLFDEANTLRDRAGHRHCRACRNAWNATRRRTKKARIS